VGCNKTELRFTILKAFEQLEDAPGKVFYIEAPWMERQVVKLNDYIVCPLSKGEVYRIA
jgi:hypothetical protein